MHTKSSPEAGAAGARHDETIRHPRTPWSTALLLTFVALSLAMSAVAAHAVTPSWKQTQFVLGTWHDPYISDVDTTVSYRNVRALNKAFFNIMTGLGGADAAMQLDAAAGGGVGSFVGMGHSPNSGMQSPSSCLSSIPGYSSALSTVQDFLASLTAEQRAAFTGINLGDEPDTCWAPYARVWAKALHNADSTKAYYINLFPGGADGLGLVDYANKFWNTGAPEEQPDVISIDMYPWQNPPAVNNHFFTQLSGLQSISNGRPFWLVTNAWNLRSAIGPVREPEENQLRWDVFAPTAYNAKGVIFIGMELNNFWSVSESSSDAYEDTYPPVRNDWQTSAKYKALRTIGHYMRDVVGPVVMDSKWVGVYHKSAHFSETDTTFRVYFEQVVSGSKPVVSGIGNDGVMVGVFKRFESPDTATYLLVVNKTLAPATSTIGLDANYAGASVGAAPSVVNYHGGRTFEPVSLNSSREFTVSLAGGEGRLFRVLKSPSVGAFAKLTSPSGGELWTAGSTQTVTWTGLSSVTACKLFTDPSLDTSELDGPSISVTLTVSGSSGTLTVPATRSTHAYLEITGLTSNGQTVRVSHPAPLRIGATPTRSWALYTVAPGGGLAQTTLELPGNIPTIAWFGGTGRRLFLSASSTGSSWTKEPMREYQVGFSRPSQCSFTLGANYGLSPAMAIDRLGVRHFAYRTMISHDEDVRYRVSGLGVCPPAEEVNIVENGYTAGMVVPAVGGTAIAVDSLNRPYVVYRYVAGDTKIRRLRNGIWEDFGPGLGFPNEPAKLVARFSTTDKLWFAFVSKAANRLYVGRMDSTAQLPMLVTVGSFGDVDLFPGTNGGMHIAYSKATTTAGVMALCYRYYNGTTMGSEETIETVTGTIGQVSVAVEGSGVAIAYLSSGALALARKPSTTWSTETVDRSCDASSICLRFTTDSTPKAWISYYDAATDLIRATTVVTSGGGGGGCGENCGPPLTEAITLRCPNPLSVRGSLRYELRLSRPARVGLALYDVAGRRVSEVAPRAFTPGTHTLEWSVRTLRPGMYFVRAQRDEERITVGSVVLVN